MQGIGANADTVRQAAVDGLTRTTLVLADQAMKRGEYAEAKPLIDRVLKVDPRNQMAMDMRAENERLSVETLDKSPHPATLQTLAGTETNRVEVAKLVQDGKLYYETGRLLKAEEALRLALKLNPYITRGTSRLLSIRTEANG